MVSIILELTRMECRLHPSNVHGGRIHNPSPTFIDLGKVHQPDRYIVFTLVKEQIRLLRLTQAQLLLCSLILVRRDLVTQTNQILFVLAKD